MLTEVTVVFRSLLVTTPFSYQPIVPLHRTATKGEIMKAYRRLARDWHPDSYEGDDEEMAEKMFLDLAAAKEVLSDPGTYIQHLVV